MSNHSHQVQDQPKSVHDVIRVCHVRRYGARSRQFNQLNHTACMEQYKSLVLETERIILIIVNFDFDVQLPYIRAATFLKVCPWDTFEDQRPDIYRLVWKLLEDSWVSTVSLQYSPEAIALALITLAAKHLNVPLETGDLWDHTVEGELVEAEIHEQIIGLYMKGEGGMFSSELQDSQSQLNLGDLSQALQGCEEYTAQGVPLPEEIDRHSYGGETDSHRPDANNGHLPAAGNWAEIPNLASNIETQATALHHSLHSELTPTGTSSALRCDSATSDQVDGSTQNIYESSDEFIPLGIYSNQSGKNGKILQINTRADMPHIVSSGDEDNV